MTDSQQNSQNGSLSVPSDISAPLSSAKLGDQSITESRTQPKIENLAINLKMAEEEHQYLREYIRNADQKAIFFFSLCSGLLAFLNAKNVSKNWLKMPSEWSMFDLTSFLSMIGLAISALFFLWVVVPRLKGSKKGLIFFNAIAEYESSEEYTSDIFRTSESDLLRAKLKHCYELAKICNAKYTKLVWGLYAGVVVFIATVIILLFGG